MKNQNRNSILKNKKIHDMLLSIRSWPATLKIGIIIVGLIAFTGIFAPLLTPYDPLKGDFEQNLVAPSWEHLFGTDATGRDVFTRTLYASRLDLQIGLITTYAPFIVGLILGTIAGYFGGWFDIVLMRLVDIAIAFPFIVLIIVILAILGPGIQNMYIAVFLLAWTMYARLSRGRDARSAGARIHHGGTRIRIPAIENHLSACASQCDQFFNCVLHVRYCLEYNVGFSD